MIEYNGIDIVVALGFDCGVVAWVDAERELDTESNFGPMANGSQGTFASTVSPGAANRSGRKVKRWYAHLVAGPRPMKALPTSRWPKPWMVGPAHGGPMVRQRFGGRRGCSSALIFEQTGGSAPPWDKAQRKDSMESSAAAACRGGPWTWPAAVPEGGAPVCLGTLAIQPVPTQLR